MRLSNFVGNGSNQGNVLFGASGNTGTVILGGNGDNPDFGGTIAFGTVVMNKGTVGGTTSAGSTFNNVTVNSGATLKYGENLTDRNGEAATGAGQIYGILTLNGTLDLNGTGTFSDNWSAQKLSGNGMITNSGDREPPSSASTPR